MCSSSPADLFPGPKTDRQAGSRRLLLTEFSLSLAVHLAYVSLSIFLPAVSPDSKEGRAGFLEWLGGVDALQLEVWAEERKNFKAKAKEDMESGGLRTAAI